MTDIVAPAPAVNRDRFGRPLIIPPDGGKPVPYTRATTLAGAIDDLYGLMNWKCRQTAIGLVNRPDLQVSVSAHADDKKQLDKIVEQALEASGSSAAATTGTAIHRLTELVDVQADIPPVAPDVATSLNLYRRLMAPIEIVESEQLVVCDELQTAGTPDRIVRWQNQNFIADIKTGQNLDYSAGKIAMQLAIYAHSCAYQPDTGIRQPLPDVHQTAAIIIHLPAGRNEGQLVWVDIGAGWEAVQLAVQVRDWRKRRNLTANFQTSPTG